MEGHESAKKRVGDPVLGMLRAFCITIKKEDRIGEEFNASQIVDVCDDHGITGLGDGTDSPRGDNVSGFFKGVGAVFSIIAGDQRGHRG